MPVGVTNGSTVRFAAGLPDAKTDAGSFLSCNKIRIAAIFP